MGEERLEASMAQPFSACRAPQMLEGEPHDFGMRARPHQLQPTHCHTAIWTVLIDRASPAALQSVPETGASAWG